MDHSPGDICEPILLRVVENVIEPLVRVECQDIHVRMGMREVSCVIEECSVVVLNILLIEWRDGSSNVVGRALKRRKRHE